MKTVTLPCGERVPALGMGTWHMGDDPKLRREEIATLRMGIETGAALIDTAEMYGDGRAEELVGESIAGRREHVFLVSKVLPSNASSRGTVAACERSLRRLKTDRLDLFLLHWHGNIPFRETVEGFVRLQSSGKIRHFGVSNLDLAEMQAWWDTPGGRAIQTNQLLYNLSRRGIEWDLVPWLREHRVPVMAYSPIEQGRLLETKELIDFCRRHGLTPPQAALAWLLSHEDVIVIPKTSRRERLKENLAAVDQSLTPEQLSELDRIFPPPSSAQPLEML